MKTISALRLAMASVLALGVVNANAANPASDVMTVTATILDSCVISVADMNFGQYDPVDANKTADNISGVADITTACTLGSAPKVSLLLNGLQVSNTGRFMDGAGTAAGETLSYGLYSDIARTAGWNVATGESIAATGVNVTTTIYGKIPMNQNKKIGVYTEAVTVEVTF